MKVMAWFLDWNELDKWQVEWVCRTFADWYLEVSDEWYGVFLWNVLCCKRILFQEHLFYIRHGRYVYLIMLSVHIGLSVAAVPLVVYQVITGITRSPSELLKLKYHRKIGRIGATSWIISLSLGVITYLLLNHIYEWKFIGT